MKVTWKAKYFVIKNLWIKWVLICLIYIIIYGTFTYDR